MKNIHIDNSYSTWRCWKMYTKIRIESMRKYRSDDAERLLNRTYRSMFIEWWLHNIGYYLTKPFCKIEAVDRLNKRFKHVDLEEWEDG